jgi:hypothetical protein
MKDAKFFNITREIISPMLISSAMYLSPIFIFLNVNSNLYLIRTPDLHSNKVGYFLLQKKEYHKFIASFIPGKQCCANGKTYPRHCR